ncbi:MAG: hypothetical protein JOY82_18270 [Streptosporangiaceae bacterium]|nr:hypothetical protein [Streptosporangiaceae bacterium]MBV9856433.1 hypothetical protein [Streptosporangiaceae bacterium]
MRKVAAGFVVVFWAVIAGCMVTACSRAESAKHAVSGFAASAAASVTRPVATTPPASATAPATTTAPATAPAATTAPATTTAAGVAPATVTPGTRSPAGVVPAPSATASAHTTSGSALTWLWVALGAAVFIALLAWIIALTTRGSRRRAAAAAGWRSRLIDAYARGAALHDAMAAAEAPDALYSADAAARWFDIQRRADDYGQFLYGLRESAADDADRMRIADVLASLQAARSAMGAERSAAGADSTLANVVRDRLAFFAASLRELREPNVRPA